MADDPVLEFSELSVASKARKAEEAKVIQQSKTGQTTLGNYLWKL